MSFNKGLRTSNFRLLVVLAVSSSLAPFSLDFFAPSMPAATRDLQASVDAVQSTLYTFLFGYAVAPFFWGALADQVGRRNVMLAGLGIYILASLGCFFASDIVGLASMRMLQGIGAACGVVLARTVLRDIHGPGGATKAISSMYMIMVWVPISAPILGGYLSSIVNWRASFLVMALLALITLIGTFFWQSETRPDAKAETSSQLWAKNWLFIISNRVFLRHSIANTFCLTSMLLFLANYSYLLEKYYEFGARESGYVLAAFNVSISLGVYLARFVVSMVGVEKSINAGLIMAFIGWTSLVATVLFSMPPGASLFSISLACLGIGMVVSLTIGQALVPFTQSAGTASALFVCIQSIGSALIAFCVGRYVATTMFALAVTLVLCSLLALISILLTSKSPTWLPKPR